MERQPKAGLYLPFIKQPYKITEGRYYSDAEVALHGFTGHGGIDFELPRGTGVLAAADGLAISSYFSYPLIKEGQPVLHQDKPISFGLGYFVIIYHPSLDYSTEYGHLDRIDPSIKFHNPKKVGEKFWPVGHKIPPEDLKNWPFVTEVKRGQVIGSVGDSGLTWGYSDYPKRPDPKQFPSYDEIHLHFGVFERSGSKGIKKFYDPFGIKGQAEDYPDSYKKGVNLGRDSEVLWLLDPAGRPLYGI